MERLQKLKLELPYDPATTSGYYLKKANTQIEKISASPRSLQNYLQRPRYRNNVNMMDIIKP